MSKCIMYFPFDVVGLKKSINKVSNSETKLSKFKTNSDISINKLNISYFDVENFNKHIRNQFTCI